MMPDGTSGWGGVQHPEALVVVRPKRDRHGDAVSFTEHTLPMCIVGPTTTSEDVGRGEQITDNYTVYVLDPAADLEATDRIRRPGDAAPSPAAGFKARAPWVVDGDPAAWQSPFTGWKPGLVVRIKREQGVGRGR